MRTASQMANQSPQKSGTAVHSKGRKRVEEILDAAHDLLVHEDYTQFTMRNIARYAGIHLSNLQYYFPTRDALIHGLIRRVADIYEGVYQELFASLAENPVARMEAVIDYLIEDIGNPVTRRFFIQFWALLESSDAHQGTLLGELYGIHIDNFCKLLRPLCPDITPAQRRQRATMIAAMIEGMMLMMGTSRRKSSELQTTMRETLLGIACS